MKEKDGFVDYPEQQMVLFVEKDDGKYGPMVTGSYLSANYMDDYLLKRRNLESGLREKMTRGEITPLGYFMVLEDLTISELAARAGIRKSRVKKHLDPAGFGKATVEELRRYSTVFNVPPANLLQVILIGENNNFESLLITENRTGRVSVTQPSTANRYVTEVKIEEREK